MTNRLDSWATPSRKPRVASQTAPELFAVTLAELERLSRIPAPRARERQACRDTLLVALLLACPVRECNLAMMEVGRHLVRLGAEWHLRFEPEETKTRQALHMVVPAALTPFVEDYLARVRPAFLGAASHVHVWPAQKGRPMAEETIYASVMSRSQRLFGTALNPHAFRSLAATLLAETSPEDALHARPLLGHRQPQTTEQHYVRANQLNAARKVAQALQEIRDA
jgi:integrase